MKKVFRFLWVAFLIFLLLIILFAVGYWAIEIRQWPWWISVVLIASVAGCVAGYFAVKKYLIRRNEKKFVQQVINEEQITPDDDTSAGVSNKEAESQWKQSVAKLKKSHLRKFGNPLYVLPWFIILGESRSGKTSAIKNSNLSSTLTDVSQATIISGTKNCDWWFLEQAIVLDTAGRYTIPIEEEKDKEEWESFLTLLAKYRKKEPINGVIVAVAADALLKEDDTSLADKAKSIRQRINQMMRILGAKFPVYLLVTKMDLVNGFTDFCDHIPEQRAAQVMGYINTDDDTDGQSILEKCMTAIFDKIRNLRSVFIQDRINNFAVTFSNEFMNLKPGLETYVRTLFGEDIYQATPFFRGIYFSSACRKGEPASDFLNTAGIVYDNDNAPDRNKGFFLRGLFSSILPKDRNVFSPLSEFIMWRRTTLSLGVFSIILICLALAGILGFSYVNNVKALNSMDKSVFKSRSHETGQTDRILWHDTQRLEIEKLQSANKNWILPRLGLKQSLELEKSIKAQYVGQVKKDLIEHMDDLFFDRVLKTNPSTPYTDVVNSALYAVLKINILKAALEHDAFPDAGKYEKIIRELFPQLDPAVAPFAVPNYVQVHYACLSWNTDKKYIKQKLSGFQKALSQIAVNSDNFEWLISDSVCSTPNVEIFNFLKGYQINTSILNDKSFVRGAFTQTGRKQIRQFIETIKNSFDKPEEFKRMEEDFWSWYATEFYRAWQNFAEAFPSGSDWRTLIENWKDIGTLMTTAQNPYFLLIDKMGMEFEAIKSEIDVEPSWADTVVMISKVKQLAKKEEEKKDGSLMAKLSMTKDKLTDKFEKSSDKVKKQVGYDKGKDLEYRMRFAAVWNEYLKNLATLSTATAYNEKCFYLFADLFKALEDPGKQQAPYNVTYDSLLKLKAFLKQDQAAPLVAGLIQGPYDFLTNYGVYQSMEYLQGKWEEIVLSASYSVDPEKYYSVMFDKSSGIIWQFVNDEAAPFLTQNKTGFLAKTAFGLKLPFSNRFFRLLNKGDQLTLEQQDEYAVSITTLPISVNNEAMIRPYSNTLMMECADEKIQLVNTNFPEEKNFVWRPDKCGDTSLHIQFEESILKKVYKGRLGFARFLKDFQDGTRVFNVTDFPEHKGYLSNNNVTDITVSYSINGITPVLEFLERRPPQIPDVIFKNFKAGKKKFPKPKSEFKTPPKEEKPAPIENRFKDRYTIAMETVPMGVNDSAQIKPIAGIMWMKCNEEVIRFENNNYPESISFEWVPATCGEVVIIIQFPEITCIKEYPNFYEFVKDFNYDSRTFNADEFPEQKDALLKKGISTVTLSYIFKGDLPKLDEKKTDKKSIPGKQVPQPKAADKSETVKQTGSDDKKTKPAPEVQKPGDTGEPTGPVTIHSEKWIRDKDPQWYTIHVMLGPDRDKIVAFAMANKMTKNTAVYKSSLNGRERYNLIYGIYDSYGDAKQELDTFSARAAKHSPWIRKFASINKEIKE